MAAEYKFFSAVCGTVFKRDHVLTLKASLKKHKKSK
jgi:hypothetical protein